jgi:glutamine amidotransferase
MCIAILNPPRVTLKKSTLLKCWENNPDGAGMIFTDTQTETLYILKEMRSAELFYKAYQHHRRKNLDSYFVLHFRIATAGKVNEDNCHPFVINEDLAFVHNGIISKARTSVNYSDTYYFNADILQNLPPDFTQNEAILELIEAAIGNSKLVFLNSKNEPLILNSHLGHYSNGVWYSNRSYETRIPAPKISLWEKYDLKPVGYSQPKPDKPAPQLWPSTKGITDLYEN